MTLWRDSPGFASCWERGLLAWVRARLCWDLCSLYYCSNCSFSVISLVLYIHLASYDWSNLPRRSSYFSFKPSYFCSTISRLLSSSASFSFKHSNCCSISTRFPSSSASFSYRLPSFCSISARLPSSSASFSFRLSYCCSTVTRFLSSYASLSCNYLTWVASSVFNSCS